MKPPRPQCGKIARLPAWLREEVNKRLYDNQKYATIIAWLHTQPDVLRILGESFHDKPITSNNLYAWKRGVKGRRGGYGEWLDKRLAVEERFLKLQILGAIIAGKMFKQEARLQ
jgi:hypothetical protein